VHVKLSTQPKPHLRNPEKIMGRNPKKPKTHLRIRGVITIRMTVNEKVDQSHHVIVILKIGHLDQSASYVNWKVAIFILDHATKGNGPLFIL